MCGIVAFCTHDPLKEHKEILTNLFLESTVRGLHAFGIASWDAGINYHRSFSWKDVLSKLEEPVVDYDCILHSRYCTSGDWQDIDNNQPIVIGDSALVFNGVISMKTKEEMEQEFHTKLLNDNDGELFSRIVLSGGDPSAFVTSIEGSFAGCWYEQEGKIYALRNERRPLWYFHYDNSTIFVASTKDIIRRAAGDNYAEEALECEPGVVYDLEAMAVQ